MDFNSDLYKLFLDNSFDWKMFTTFENQILYVSPAFTKITGYCIDDLYNNNNLFTEKIIHRDYIEYYNQNHSDKFLKSNNSHKLEFVIVTKNGDLKWIEHHCNSFVDDKGVILGRVINNRDITESKNIQLENQEEKRRFNTLINNIKGFAYRCKNDKNWTLEYVSDKCFEITGYKPEDLIFNKVISFNDLIHPKYKEYLWDKWQELLSKKEIFTDEYEIITANGQLKWVWEQGCGIYNDKDELVAIEGFIMDISDKKEYEKLILDSEQKYKTLSNLTMDSASVAYIYPNGEIKREWLNDTLLTNFGIKPSDIDTLEKYSKLIVDEDVASFLNAFNTILKGGFVSIEFRMNTPFKGVRWIKNNVVSFVDQTMGCLKVYSAVNDITESKGTQLEILKINNNLLESEKRFRELTETIASAIFIYQKDMFVYTNKAFEIISGYSNEESLKLNFWDFVHPDHTEMIKERGRKRLSGEKVPNRYEFKIIRKDGQERWVDFTADTIEYKGSIAALGTAFDITDKKLAEEKLRKLSRAVEQSSVSIIITDPIGKIEYVNPKFEEVTGYCMSEVIGQNPRILKSGHCQESVYKELWETINNGKEWKGELYNKKKDGTFYWENVVISPIFNKLNQITHYVSIKEDITDLKKMMNELIVAKEKAEESERLKTAFLANMSHEIRTPMNAIMGFSELLTYDDMTKIQKKEFADIISRRSNDLLRIIDDILDISKIESGVMSINETSGCINDMLNDLFQLYKYKDYGNEKKIDIIIGNKDLNGKFIVFADFSRLKQIFINLIDNSLKFTEKGYIEFGYTIEYNKVKFYVKDTGIGIKHDKQELIFDRFSQVHDGADRTIKGTGLGLSISKGLIKIMNGDIWFESKFGSGTIFYFTVPYIKSELEDNESKFDDSNLNKLKILIVEDDKANNRLLEFILLRENAIVLNAQNGKEAIDLLLQNNDVKIALVDIGLPDIDGLELVKHLKEILPNIKIIIQTAYGGEENKIASIYAQCDYFLTKPINKNLLLEKINEII